MGRAYKFADNIDTDVIIPARYLNIATPEHLAAHCMEDADPAFASRVKSGDVIVAGENFGCGSSREHAPLAIKCCGVKAIIAKSFARIFYRNAINIGLPIIVSKEACDGISDGDEVETDLENGVILNKNTGLSYTSEPFPDFIKSIIEKGGLLNCQEEFK